MKHRVAPLPTRQTIMTFMVIPEVLRKLTPFILALEICGCASSPAEGQPTEEQADINNRPPLNLKYVEPRLIKKFIGTRSEEYRFVQYAENWRVRVERVGTFNYPEDAKGKLNGELILSVSVNSDGTVRQVEIDKSSGHKVLDDAARRIVMMAAPYDPFPPEIQRDTDILVITRVWKFTSSNQIETK